MVSSPCQTTRWAEEKSPRLTTSAMGIRIRREHKHRRRKPNRGMIRDDFSFLDRPSLGAGLTKPSNVAGLEIAAAKSAIWGGAAAAGSPRRCVRDEEVRATRGFRSRSSRLSQQRGNLVTRCASLLAVSAPAIRSCCANLRSPLHSRASACIPPPHPQRRVRSS